MEDGRYFQRAVQCVYYVPLRRVVAVQDISVVQPVCSKWTNFRLK
jgi:hypothetical protein